MLDIPRRIRQSDSLMTFALFASLSSRCARLWVILQGSMSRAEIKRLRIVFSPLQLRVSVISAVKS